jgi:EAL domain-containing protein (putative c-di-GMP-specific phosphodiesterase class I)/AmiR/NasT family two-component response regulator
MKQTSTTSLTTVTPSSAAGAHDGGRNRVLEQFAGMRVFVIDDNVSNVNLLRELLKRQGLERVYIETNARAVERRLADVRPDLVLLDLHMPYLDGFDLLECIQRYAGGNYLPVLVLTADNTVQARNRALGLGAQDFLIKPLDMVETCLRIANLLQTRRLYSTLREANAPASPSVRDESFDERLERIEWALHERAITTYVQPVVDIATLTTVGREALSRFPTSSFVGGPDRWFSDAFTVGRGVDLEWLAVEKAIECFDTQEDDAFLAVNMSPATIMHIEQNDLCRPDLCSRVVVELTEHVPVENYTALERALAPMREHGLRLAADDVGAGYAGFRHLLRLRPDIIKLDMSLVTDIHLNHGQRALAQALLSFASDVGAKVIAEGVETADELNALRELGVEWAQGYHLGRPLPAVDA